VSEKPNFYLSFSEPKPKFCDKITKDSAKPNKKVQFIQKSSANEVI